MAANFAKLPEPLRRNSADRLSGFCISPGGYTNYKKLGSSPQAGSEAGTGTDHGDEFLPGLRRPLAGVSALGVASAAGSS